MKSADRVRAWWLQRQGLTPATRPRTLAECIRTTGWLPTAGGPCAYLSFRARMPGVTREQIDRAVLDGNPLVEAPGGHARAAVIVPRDELTLALRLAAASRDRHLAPQIRKGAVDRKVIQSLSAAITRVLDEGPQPTDAIREAVSSQAARSLEWFQAALADLMLRGLIRRFPANARIDSPKYLYELIHPDDRADLNAEGEEHNVVAKLAEIFLHRHGPATVDDLVWWTGVTKTEARRALASVRAERTVVDGWSTDAWLHPRDVAAWHTFSDGNPTQVTLLPFRDPFIYARRPPAILSDHPDGPVLDWKARRIRLREADSLHHHAILDGGRLVGVWEYDVEQADIVTRLWPTDPRLKKRIAAAAAETAMFIREQIGDMRFYAADSASSRAPRIAFCRSRR